MTGKMTRVNLNKGFFVVRADIKEVWYTGMRKGYRHSSNGEGEANSFWASTKKQSNLIPLWNLEQDLIIKVKGRLANTALGDERAPDRVIPFKKEILTDHLIRISVDKQYLNNQSYNIYAFITLKNKNSTVDTGGTNFKKSGIIYLDSEIGLCVTCSLEGGR